MKLYKKILTAAAIAIPGAYLFALAPGKRQTRLKDRLCKYDYAHRGLHDNLWKIPENSMAAFKKALDHGVGIELDIHLTKDHQLVVFHDDTLNRMCHIDRNIYEMTWDELKDIHLLDTNQTIPKFEDVLRLVNGQVPLIVELKVDHNNYHQLCAAADQILAAYKGDFCIESFHPLALAWFKKNNSEIIRGQLSYNFRKSPVNKQLMSFAMTHLLTNFLTRPDFIAYAHQDIGNISFWLNQKLFGAMTVLWTVRTKTDMDRLKKRGHIIIFENFTP